MCRGGDGFHHQGTKLLKTDIRFLKFAQELGEEMEVSRRRRGDATSVIRRARDFSDCAISLPQWQRLGAFAILW